jgi:hypothetical protein
MATVCPRACLWSGADFHEVSIRVFVNDWDLNFLLQIRMLLRLTPALEGDKTVCGIIAMNDTSSNILSHFTTDFQGFARVFIGLAKSGGEGEEEAFVRELEWRHEDRARWGVENVVGDQGAHGYVI